ncbi:TPA: hypothetical protein ACHU8X_002648 [Enterococcus faecalis]
MTFEEVEKTVTAMIDVNEFDEAQEFLEKQREEELKRYTDLEKHIEAQSNTFTKKKQV